MFRINIGGAEATSSLLKKYISEINLLQEELSEMEVGIKRNHMTAASREISDSVREISELSIVLSQIQRALELTIFLSRQTERKVLEDLEGGRQDFDSPDVQLVSYKDWDSLPEDIVIEY